MKLYALLGEASASTLDLTSVKAAMSSAFSSVQSGAVDMISTATPYALAIIGTVMVVTIGIGVFKKITAKA